MGIPYEFDFNEKYDDFDQNNEQTDTWFLGSLINGIHFNGDFRRIASLHNRITHNETNFDECTQKNLLIASQLAEFFPYKWLLEITAILRRIKASTLCVKTFKDRICTYLGFIELYLTFRGKTILDSTLDEINDSFDSDIDKNTIRFFKLKLIRVIPGLREQWVKIRAQSHQAAFFSTVIHVMNTELVLDDYCTKEEIFLVKQACLNITRSFLQTNKAPNVKKPEVWARVISLKAVYNVIPNYPHFPFINLTPEAIKTLRNKLWQLNQELSKI